MRRLRFDVVYDGTDFNGWQVQPGLPTIQGTLQDVIGSIEGKPVHVAGSGRTDAGVHAFGQVAAVSLENPIPPDFHPRFHARRKTYEYRIFRDEVCPPFDRRFVYHHPYPLNESAMFGAAPLLEGDHDFAAFAAADERDALNASKVRTIFRSALVRQPQMLIYTVTGSGFLKHMVRNIVGVLLEVGKGNLNRDSILARLASGSAMKAGPTSPASGLFLVSVEYD